MFGAKLSVPALGIILNDEMDDFAVAPGVPNAYHLEGERANEVRRGKRPLSSMTPIIVTKNGVPVMTTGGSGGPTIISGVLQVTLNILAFHLDAASAVAEPRIHEQAAPDVVIVEEAMPAATRGALEQMGYKLKVVPESRRGRRDHDCAGESSAARPIRAKAAAPSAISDRTGTLDSTLVSGTARNEIASPAFAAPPPQFALAYDVAAIVALSVAVCMFHLGSFGLWEPDEARYAEIAREMLQSGNLLVPHLNYVAYVEKPPLLYWLTTLSFWIFGVSEFAARLPVALSAIAGILATYFFALRAFGRRHAILAAAILATTPLYALMAQVLTTDMTLTALVTIATFSLYLHWQEGGRWCWLAYVAMGSGDHDQGPGRRRVANSLDADLAGAES